MKRMNKKEPCLVSLVAVSRFIFFNMRMLSGVIVGAGRVGQISDEMYEGAYEGVPKS